MARYSRRDAALMLAGLPLLLTGCGFRLRGRFDAPFATLYLQMPVNTSLSNKLRRAITAGSDVVIVDHPNEADAVLELLREERDREILSINDMGQAREYELTLTLEFRITAPEGFDWLEATRLSTTRDISYNESEFLSREKEENVLYDDMESDLINQLVRYIEAVKPRDLAY